jgi:hypothetical protein
MSGVDGIYGALDSRAFYPFGVLHFSVRSLPDLVHEKSD